MWTRDEFAAPLLDLSKSGVEVVGDDVEVHSVLALRRRIINVL